MKVATRLFSSDIVYIFVIIIVLVNGFTDEKKWLRKARKQLDSDSDVPQRVKLEYCFVAGTNGTVKVGEYFEVPGTCRLHVCLGSHNDTETGYVSTHVHIITCPISTNNFTKPICKVASKNSKLPFPKCCRQEICEERMDSGSKVPVSIGHRRDNVSLSTTHCTIPDTNLTILVGKTLQLPETCQLHICQKPMGSGKYPILQPVLCPKSSNNYTKLTCRVDETNVTLKYPQCCKIEVCESKVPYKLRKSGSMDPDPTDLQIRAELSDLVEEVIEYFEFCNVPGLNETVPAGTAFEVPNTCRQNICKGSRRVDGELSMRVHVLACPTVTTITDPIDQPICQIKQETNTDLKYPLCCQEVICEEKEKIVEEEIMVRSVSENKRRNTGKNNRNNDVNRSCKISGTDYSVAIDYFFQVPNTCQIYICQENMFGQRSITEVHVIDCADVRPKTCTSKYTNTSLQFPQCCISEYCDQKSQKQMKTKHKSKYRN